MAAALPMRVLSRLWQMLLKALEEVASAPNAMMATEMAVIRMTHVADLPDPETLIKKIQQGSTNTQAAGRGSAPSTGPVHGATLRARRAGGGAVAAAAPAPQHDPMADALARFASFDDVVELIARMRDMTLLLEVESNLRLVNYRPGRIEFEPTPQASRDLAATLSARLQGWTGARWGVSVVSEGGAPTIAEVKAEEMAKAEAEAMKNPLVAEIFARFPGAKIEILPEEDTAAIEAEALAEVEDEWDPFEEG